MEKPFSLYINDSSEYMAKQKNKGSKGKKPFDFLTEANIERLTYNPNIQKMFGMKDKEEKQENDDSQKKLVFVRQHIKGWF